MANLDQIDSRLAVMNSLGRDDLTLYDAKEEPFTLYGLTYSDGQYRRMPKEIAASVSDGIVTLSEYTAGGRVAFIADTDAVAISCKRPALWRMSHMALVGSAGFDIYERNADGSLVFCGVFMPSQDGKGYASLVKFHEKKRRELVIHFPLYCPISELLIGLPNDTVPEKWSGYRHEKPIVFYGSSITQGGCASTAGNDYASRISRRFDANYLNFGFSGSCKAETPMMEYLSALEMRAFVYDYDYNAPSAEYLKETHYTGYRIIREKNPELPIIMCTMPSYDLEGGAALPRRDVILESYRKALESGDRHVGLVDSKEAYPTFNADGCTVDRVHPNDFGFYRMSEAIGAKIAEFLGK